MNKAFKFTPSGPKLTAAAKAQRVVATMLGEEPKKPAPRRRAPSKPKE